MSSITVDDTDSHFDYKDDSWAAGGQTGEFEGTSHSTSTGGAMVTFGPFTGTSIAVFSTVGTRQTKLHFVLDGDSSSDLPAQTNPSVQFQQQVYSAGNLDPTEQHTLAINLLDPGPFTLDYVRIGSGQSNTAIQLTSSVPTSTSIASGTSTVTVHPTDIAVSPSVGDGTSITSPSKSVTSDSITSPSPSITPTSSESSSTLVGAGASPSSSAQGIASASSGVSTPTSSSTISMGADNTSRPDAIVIGSVTGAIAFFAIIIVSVLLFLRRRRKRLALQGQQVSASKPSRARNVQSRHRPSLHLSIPSTLSFSRALQRPTLLPIHSSKSTPVKQADPFGSSRPTPAFLTEDPNDSPVFDIKQRPVSGSTVTTRVTVGTTIGQRSSVPDSVYRYPNPETPTPVPVPVPPIPVLHSGKGLNPSPTETGASSTRGSPSRLGFGLGLSSTNQGGTVDTSIYAGYSENGLAPTASATSASRPLPHIPDGAKRSQTYVDREGDGYAPQMEKYSYGHRHLPTTPSEAETFVHRDAGVRLASSIHTQPRRELPPPYQDYGI
ncbi:hypothetical protein ACEPAI_10011 [Sanghuangporus weigelae]